MNGQEAPVLVFRSRKNPYPPSRYNEKIALFMLIAFLSLAAFYFLEWTWAAETFLCSSLLIFFLILAAFLSPGIDYFEYSVYDDRICLKTIYSSPKSSLFWNAVIGFQTLRSLRPSPCFNLKNLVELSEVEKDGSRALLLREKGPLTRNGGPSLLIYLPKDRADEIIARVRSLVKIAD